MKITSSAIIAKINLEFQSIYKPFSKFPGSGLIWTECINTIKDEKLMNHIIFCNDILQIPPVKVFLAANNNVNQDFTDFEKKAIGAFWGFVFKFVFNYSLQKDNVPVNIKGLKKATYFYDIQEVVEVTNGGEENLQL